MKEDYQEIVDFKRIAKKLGLGRIWKEGYVEIFLLLLTTKWSFSALIAAFFTLILVSRKHLLALNKAIVVVLHLVIGVLLAAKQVIIYELRPYTEARELHACLITLIFFIILSNYKILKNRSSAELYFLSFLAQKSLNNFLDDGHIWICEFYAWHVVLILVVGLAEYALVDNTRFGGLGGVLLLFFGSFFGIIPWYFSRIFGMLVESRLAILAIFGLIAVVSGVSFAVVKAGNLNKVYIRKFFHFLSVFIFSSLIETKVS